MGYAVRRISYPKRPWRLTLQVTENGKRRDHHVSEDKWRELGILPTMTVDEVKARVRQLNAVEAVKRRGAKRQKIDARLKNEALTQTAFLPAPDVVEFERTVLFAREHDPKLASHWAAVRRCLCELELKPEDWEYHATKFYDLFSAHQYSMSYVWKLIPVINKWGYFLARKYKLPFLPLPFPAGRERFKIEDAYYEANKDGHAPRPLTPKALEKKRSELPPAQYRWLFLSIWFGLRPEEVDGIAAGRHYEVKRIGKETALAVYQTKLTSIAREDRWKLIPITCKEQREALTMIGESMKRPLAKTLTKLFGPRVGLRSGRKNFTDMMLDRGHPLEDVSAWLGHRSIQRTWTNYRDRQKLRYTKKAA
jgi:hypothetical protein